MNASDGCREAYRVVRSGTERALLMPTIILAIACRYASPRLASSQHTSCRLVTPHPAPSRLVPRCLFASTPVFAACHCFWARIESRLFVSDGRNFPPGAKQKRALCRASNYARRSFLSAAVDAGRETIEKLLPFGDR